MSASLLSHAVSHLEILPGHCVLDLGCGDGVYSHQVSLMSPGLFVALDLDMTLLQHLTLSTFPLAGSGKVSTFAPMCADALKLPFPDATFDRVICSLVLYFLPFQAALTELARVVKADGRIYLRLPMLTAARTFYILQNMIRDPRKSIYTALLSINGFWYSVSGRQFANPFLRHERMAFLVPRKRFEEAVTLAGFRVECLEIDRSKPYTAAIDAWLRKTR